MVIVWIGNRSADNGRGSMVPEAVDRGIGCAIVGAVSRNTLLADSGPQWRR